MELKGQEITNNMKKIISVIVCFAIASILNVKAQPSIAALHHAGSVTLFSSAQLQTALDTAVPGDTIYLSEGSYPSITLDNGQVLIGTGENTIIGDIIIQWSDRTDRVDYTLDCLNIKGSISSVKSIKSLSITQCLFERLNPGTTTVENGITVISSYCRDILCSRCSVTAVSSKIGQIAYTPSDGHVYYSHCNIGRANISTGTVPTFILKNCIVGIGPGGTCAIDCLIGTWPEGNKKGSITGGWFIGSDVLDENLDCTYSELSSCIGSDGTVVGITGGDTPYTLTPVAPHVSDHKIEVDAENQKLNVTLTIEN